MDLPPQTLLSPKQIDISLLFSSPLGFGKEDFFEFLSAFSAPSTLLSNGLFGGGFLVFVVRFAHSFIDGGGEGSLQG